jgi:hypothetical protein
MATAKRSLWVLAAVALSACSLTLVPGAVATTTVTGGAIVPPPMLALEQWTSNTANLAPVTGVVEWDGKPVVGAQVRVDEYVIPKATNAAGQFTYLVDDTLLERHIVSIADSSNATVGGAPLTDAEQSTLATLKSAITVGYPVSDLRVTKNPAGDPVVSGTIVDAAKLPPPHVALATYALSGTVTDSTGKPVAGAQVSTRTVDRDYWTVSTTTDATGHYTSLFSASDEENDDPVPLTIRVTDGSDIYQFLPAEYVYFTPLESATLNLQLPPSGFPMALPLAKSFPGALYRGTVVGAETANGHVIRPLKTTWTDASGHFSMTLPHSFAGKTVSLWEGTLDLFSVKPATPGGPVDLRNWPRVVAPSLAQGVARVRLS